MRLFLALAALCASALYGYGKGYALTARQAGLVAFERDIPQLLHRMEYRVLPLGALVEEMGEKPGDLAAFWRTFGEKLEGLGVERAWEDALEAQSPYGLQPQDRAILRGLGSALACTDDAGRRETANGLLEEIHRQRAEAEKEREKKSALYGTLGLLWGLGAAILII